MRVKRLVSSHELINFISTGQFTLNVSRSLTLAKPHMKTATITIFLILLELACKAQELQSDDGVIFIPSGYPMHMSADPDHSLTYSGRYYILALPISKDHSILRFDGEQIPKMEKYQADKYLLTYKKLPEVRQTPDTNLYSGNPTYYSDRGEIDGPVMFSTYNKQSESVAKKYVIEKTKFTPRVWSY
jgi:hypothetical protein